MIYKKFIPGLAIVFLCIFLFTTTARGEQAEYSRESPVVRAVRKVSPAVVNISSERIVRHRSHPFSAFRNDPLFDQFFKDFFEPGFEREQKRTSLGSGVIIDGKRGFILTNAHVISKAGTITVGLKDEREFVAEIVGADPDSDLAVLKIASKQSLPSIEMGSSSDLMIGETVIAIGNPFGFSHTVTTGVISSISRSLRVDDMVYQDFIQTDASINPGNSGGPLLNINGELIGINTAIYAKAQGIGFAIPINKAKRIISNLIRFGEVVDPWIGIHVQDIDQDVATYLAVKEAMGVLVKTIDGDSPSRKAGIQEGDIILSVGKRKVHSSGEFRSALRGFSAGNLINLDLLRNNNLKTVSVKASVFPDNRALGLAYQLLGVKGHDVKGSNRNGVMISELNRRSYLAGIGAGKGDIILRVNEIPINNMNDFKKAIIKYRYKSSVIIQLQRDNQVYNITVKL